MKINCLNCLHYVKTSSVCKISKKTILNPETHNCDDFDTAIKNITTTTKNIVVAGKKYEKKKKLLQEDKKIEEVRKKPIDTSKKKEEKNKEQNGMFNGIFDEIFDLDETLTDIEDFNKDTKDDQIKAILKIIPITNIYAYNKCVEKISNKTVFNKTQLKNIYKQLKKPKIESDQNIEKLMINYIDITGELLEEPIRYNENYIVNCENGLFFIENGILKEILQDEIKILSKTIDIRKNFTDLYTFTVGEKQYRIMSLRDILNELNPQIQMYSKIGRDVIKKYFNYVKNKRNIPFFNPQYTLGWDDGWKLPINEKQLGITFITHTDIQEQIYQNCKKNLYRIYSNEEKQKIKQKFKKFYKRTQIIKNKQALIIGWCISAPFRLYFIDNFQLFVVLWLFGYRIAGKSAMGDFYITHFYKIFNSHESPITFENEQTLSQLQDITTMTFPINAQELTFISKLCLSFLKEITVSNPIMRKKTPTQQLKVNKECVAPICLDSNPIIEGLNDSAVTTKILPQSFGEHERVKDDPIWFEMRKWLYNKHLFSLIYDKTKDWDNSNIDKIIKKLKIEYKDILEEVGNYDQRLKYTLLSILFGIYLFEFVFEIKLESNNITELFKISRTYISQDLSENFFTFVNECIDLQEYNDEVNRVKEHNRIVGLNKSRDDYEESPPQRRIPFYLRHGLPINSKGVYIFSNIFIRDFNDRYKTYIRPKDLYEEVSDTLTLENKELMEFGSFYCKVSKSTGSAIKIKPQLLKNLKQIKEK